MKTKRRPTLSRAPLAEVPSVELAPFAESHLDATWQWLQDPGIQEGFLLEPPASRESHQRWFEERVRGGSTDAYHFGIHWEGRHVGNCGLKAISARHRTAEAFIYLAPTATGKGLASAAIRELQCFAKDRGLRKLYLHVRTDNAPALRLYLKNGFRLEGTLIRELLWRGQEIDTHRLGWFGF